MPFKNVTTEFCEGFKEFLLTKKGKSLAKILYLRFEKEYLTKICILTSNNLETSEVLYSVLFYFKS
ncbi:MULTISPECIES: hypothetical protein [Capnocytophaga]|uniref:hypothetical protein n=1 Tax=Capnocytophaga TaxID=1016 RepID=UPI0035ABCAE3